METYEKWQDLSQLYAGKGDEELLELREAFEDLTDAAQVILRDELRRRSLWSDRKSPALEVDTAPDMSDEELQEYLRRGGIPVGEYATTEEAGLYAYVLELAGVKSAVTRNTGITDIRWPQLRVAIGDVERARSVIAQPIPNAVQEDYQASNEESDFVAPTCKRCAASDPLLEQVEPTNQWRCEQCGAVWQDPLPAR